MKQGVNREKGLPKAWIYILSFALIITAIFSITVFVPQSPPTNALFSVSIRSYTTGYEKSYYSEYASTIRTNLGEIGIDVSVKSSDYATFLDKVIINRDFDLAILEFEMDAAPHLEIMFKENASLNIFNYKSVYDDNYVINRLEEAEHELDFSIRRNIYFDIQDYLMDNVVPLIPLFTPVDSYAVWNHVLNFSAELGLSDSLPYMYPSETQTSQEEPTELRIGIGYWSSINPLDFTRSSEELLVSLFMDKLIKTKTDGSVTNGGLIKSWVFTNATTLLLTARDKAYWQPDVDNIYKNEPFSIDDVIFTISVLKSPYTNNEYLNYNWIKSIRKYNSTTIEISIDANPETPVNEPYAYALEDLSVYALPEHYLNISGSWESITSSPNWIKYSNSPFGTGKYKIDYENTEKSVTIVMNKFENWHKAGVIAKAPTDLKYDELWINTYRDIYALALSLQNGDIDLSYFGRNPQMVTELSNSNIQVQHAPTNSIIFLAFNLNHPVFGGENNFVNTTEPGVSKALAIRKAMALAINRDQLNLGFHNDEYLITDSPLPESSQYYYSGVTKYDFSLQKAINYLKLAGFSVGTEETNQETTTTPIDGISGVIALTTVVLITKKNRRIGR
ncbi:MAG: ABC transporter substrate-binding protein [Candidatus Heimdallarchaeaceae archaeon]